MSARIDKEGNRIFPRVVIKIFSFDNKKCQTLRYRAKPKHGFHADGIDKILEKTADQVSKQFPAYEYRLIELGPTQYSFVCEGLKATYASATP